MTTRNEGADATTMGVSVNRLTGNVTATEGFTVDPDATTVVAPQAIANGKPTLP